MIYIEGEWFFACKFRRCFGFFNRYVIRNRQNSKLDMTVPKKHLVSILNDLNEAQEHALKFGYGSMSADHEAKPTIDSERIAQLIAHRACCGSEHDTANGKLHGYCVVCGVPWPCAYAGVPPKDLNKSQE